MIKCFASTNSFWIDPQGHIRPCARFKGKFNHITEFQTFSEITNSQQHREIKESLDNDIWPQGCIRCKTDEENGVRSKRSFYDRIGLKAPDDFMIDISMGNFCNLKCRMCGPNNSTLWNNDYKFLVDHEIIQPVDIDLSAYQLSDRDIEKLINHLQSVKGNIFIELKGGEPLIMPQTKKMVDHIMSLENADKITLLIVTNGTVVPDWIENISIKIKKLLLVVSVDGLNEVYDYIRGTEKFSYQECYENIEKFSKIPNIDLKFNVVVQNLNIHQILDIHQKLIAIGDSINYLVLQFPEYLAVNVMPKESREQIYQNFVEKSDQFGSYTDLMKNIHNMLKIDPNESTLKRFYEVSRSLDYRRGQDLFSVLPHFQ